MLEVFMVKARNSWTGPEGSRKLHMEVVRLSALRTGLLYSLLDSLVPISVRGVDPRAIVRPAGLSQ